MRQLLAIGRMTSVGALALLFPFVACSSDSDRVAAATGGTGASQKATGGAGADSSAGGSSCIPTTLFAFDKNKGGFALSNYVDTSTDTSTDGGQGKLVVNLNAPGDAGNVNVAPAFDQSNAQEHTEGHSPKGVLSIAAQFTDWDQWIITQVSAPKYTDGQVVDFSDRIITGQVYMEGDGITPSVNQGGAKLFLQTGGQYVWGAGDWTILKVNEWKTLTLDTKALASTNPDWDPSDPQTLGIQISSGSDQAAGAFGGPRNVSIYVDDIAMSCGL